MSICQESVCFLSAQNRLLSSFSIFKKGALNNATPAQPLQDRPHRFHLDAPQQRAFQGRGGGWSPSLPTRCRVSSSDTTFLRSTLASSSHDISCGRMRLLWCVCLSTLAVQTFCSCTAGTDRQTDGSPTDIRRQPQTPPLLPFKLYKCSRSDSPKSD